MCDFTVIIPARLSSSRLPEKALADIAGKPMVVRVAQRAMQSRAGRVVVATDHERIRVACLRENIDVVMTSEQHQSGTDRLAQAVALLGLADDEIVVNVQGDEPLIAVDLINRMAEKLALSSAPVATAAHYIDDFDEFLNPNCVKVVLDKSQQALYFSRAAIGFPRDTLPERRLSQPLPLRHIGIYAYRTGFLKRYHELAVSPLEYIEKLEQLRVLWHGYPIVVDIVADMPANGVDTLADLERVRCVFAKE